MSLFRPTANIPARKLGCLLALCAGALGLFAVPAQAQWHHWHRAPVVAPAPPAVSAELAVCPGQIFSQPFTAFDDENFYTEVEGSGFDSGPEGWYLRGGAEVVNGTRPDASSGGVLQLPSGSVAISPPVCVTLQYPTARAWVQTVQGDGGVAVGVYYAGTQHGAARAEQVGVLGTETNGDWELSEPFEVKPELTGSVEGVREVRFVFANYSWHSAFRLSGLYVDPRMR